jgi:hypothetical protein
LVAGSVVGFVLVCFGLGTLISPPSATAMLSGLWPKMRGDSLYTAVGLIGANVVPHTFYLHSALLQVSIKPSASKTPNMAICITDLCNGGIFSFYLGFLIAIHPFEALFLCYKISSVDRVKLKSFSHKQTICSRGSYFPTLQKIHSGRLGVKVREFGTFVPRRSCVEFMRC